MSQRIPPEFIENLVNRLDIVSVISKYLPLRKAGANFVACCPFHNEKTPSFSVNQSKQFYHCFGCGVSGDVIQFIIEHKHLSFAEAVTELAADLGMTLPTQEHNPASSNLDMIYNVLFRAAQYFKQQLRQHKLSKQAVDYLKQRGVDGVVAKQYSLGFAPPGWDNLYRALGTDKQLQSNAEKAGLIIPNQDSGRYHDRFRNRIMFPIHNLRGKVIGFGGRALDPNDRVKYLNSPETATFVKGQELYGLYEARQSIRALSQAIVVEGYMDVIALAQAGIANVVATLGTACTKQQLELLFARADEIIFCFDSDSAGQKAAWRVLELSLGLIDDKHRLKFLSLVKGHDPDSYVRNFGVDAMRNSIRSAESLPDYLINTLAAPLDLEHIDGQVAFASSLKSYIAKIPTGFTKQLLEKRLTQMLDINTEQASKTQNYKARHLVQDSKPIMVAPLSPALRILSYLLENRDLISELPSSYRDFSEVDYPGTALLVAVLELLEQDRSLTIDAIKAQLSDNFRRQFQPAQLRANTRLLDRAGVIKELEGACALLQKRANELLVEKLLQKAKSNSLSEQEKQLLAQLLREKG